MVTQPTQDNNYLDFVLVILPSVLSNLVVIEPLFTSCDHASVEFLLPCPHTVVHVFLLFTTISVHFPAWLNNNVINMI